MFLKRPQMPLGIAIDHDKICMVETAWNQKKWMLQSVWFEPSFIQCAHAGEIKDWQTFKTKLKAFVCKHQLNGRPVVMNVPDHLINWSTLTVPAATNEKTMQSMIKDHMAFEFPQSDQSFHVDFQLINQPDQRIKKIILAVIRKTYIDELVKCLEGADLVPKIIDLRGHAIWRVLTYFFNRLPDAIFYQLNQHIVFLNRQEEIIYTNEYQSEDDLETHHYFLTAVESIKSQAQVQKNMIVCAENETKEKFQTVNSSKKINIEVLNCKQTLFCHDEHAKSAFQELSSSFLIAMGCALRGRVPC